MLTRLKVNGFKNLVNVDIRFGPFTCIAGPNAVGKSNLFDAIRFLSSLADDPLTQAAMSVRDPGRTSEVRNIFHRIGDDYDDEMSFEVEMIIPREGVDELGQRAVATTTFLRYAITLAHRSDGFQPSGKLEILNEELSYFKKGEARERLLFHPKAAWVKSAVTGARHGKNYISTTEEKGNRVVRLHNDAGGGDALSSHVPVDTIDTDVKTRRPKKSGGRPSTRLAAKLPRTVLSATNAAESPTALLARNEMRSWRLLQLEPSALRKSDELFTSPATLGMDGSHLAATLYRLATTNGKHGGSSVPVSESALHIYGQVARRLSELIEDVYEVTVDRDEQRRLLTLLVSDREGTFHPARDLSDGTLRFLALSVLELDHEAQGVICLEEPENGIHPNRIPAMLHLLQDIVTDTSEPIGADNPLRQIIINTHSPSVVLQVPEDSLLVAELKQSVRSGARFKHASFHALPGTWRTKDSKRLPIPMGKLLAYLNPVVSNGIDAEDKPEPLTDVVKSRRVVDRPDIQSLLPFPQQGEP